VVSERTDPSLHTLPFVWRFLRKHLYRFADLVIAQTPRIQQWLEKECDARVAVIPNFIAFSDAQVYVHSEHVPDKTIIAVGRLHHEKGFDLLISAFSLVIRRHEAWKLLILGEGDDRKKLQFLIDRLGIAHAVELRGFIKNPHALMSQAQIAVQPSRCEGFPNALLEAMSLGLPVLATEAAGSMLVTDDVNGLLVPSDNPEKLTAALMRLVESPDLRIRLGLEAEKVKHVYNMASIFQLWDGALNIRSES
jgi:GalNAc-alpha-(1->4)-GalNAc-alpha-(1->3)-diNAcBac-PP-undecaprenol alpha-1,4-N-acetyl-D-galactosaminyltransferase